MINSYSPCSHENLSLECTKFKKAYGPSHRMKHFINPWLPNALGEYMTPSFIEALVLFCKSTQVTTTFGQKVHIVMKHHSPLSTRLCIYFCNGSHGEFFMWEGSSTTWSNFVLGLTLINIILHCAATPHQINGIKFPSHITRSRIDTP